MLLYYSARYIVSSALLHQLKFVHPAMICMFATSPLYNLFVHDPSRSLGWQTSQFYTLFCFPGLAPYSQPACPSARPPACWSDSHTDFMLFRFCIMISIIFWSEVWIIDQTCAICVQNINCGLMVARACVERASGSGSEIRQNKRKRDETSSRWRGGQLLLSVCSKNCFTWMKNLAQSFVNWIFPKVKSPDKPNDERFHHCWLL